MGVHGLWSLLAPCGRRTSVDALARKRLAVDASIWLIQFVKAMRDDKGEMIANAPLLGLFRRLTKLLYLRVRPVLVFDGATPARGRLALGVSLFVRGTALSRLPLRSRAARRTGRALALDGISRYRLSIP